MTRIQLKVPVWAILAMLAVPAVGLSETAGYWQYVRTETYERPYPKDTAYPDSHVGGEGNLSVLVSEPSVSPLPSLGVVFTWGRLPGILIPGATIYWPVAGRVYQNTPGRFLRLVLDAQMYPYAPVSDLPATVAKAGFWASTRFANVNLGNEHPVDTVLRDNAAQWKPPGIVPAKSMADENGFATVVVTVQSATLFYWSHIYRWVSGPIGNCGGACTLASPGVIVPVAGGPVSVAITATSSWDVITSDDWVQVTSSKNSTGNATVTIAVSPNTGPPRNTTVIIGGQPFVISQDGVPGATISSTPGTSGSLDLHRPKLVVTDSGGATVTLQPAPGKNDGSDDGSANAGKDTGVFGQTSGGWGNHNFAKESPVFVMNSTCNDSSGYAYVQFSLAGMPLQNVSSAKVQVYVTSQVVNNLTANPANPVFAVRRVTSAWDESKMTWNSGQPTFDGAVVDSQTLSGVAGVKTQVSAWLTYDITNLYKGWAAGSTPNYGLRFSHENGQCMNGWQGLFYTSNDQPPASTGTATCAYSLSLSGASAPAAGSNGSFTVNASAATCGWSASPDATWIHIVSAASGTGSAAISYTVDANSGGARSGTITVTASGQSLTYTVSQAAGGSTGPGSASTCSGTCSLSSPGQPISATGGPGSVSVTATASWTAVAVDNWIHLTSSPTNTGNSTVTFTVDANTLGPRNGTLSIGNQTYTIFQNGTPTGTTAGCAYLIQSSTVQNVPAGGTTSGLIQVVTAQNCDWKSSTTTAWITLRSGTSSTGNGAVAYTVPQNDSANSRSGSIVIAGQNVVVNQAAGTTTPAPGAPVISAGGVVNTASYASGGPPNGRLAQGSFFSIYGSTVGPETPVQATTYPLPTTLGGVSVQITSGSAKYSAPLVFVYKGQINAILPSNVPVGNGQMTVTYNGLTSQPADIVVAKTSLGIFFQRVNGRDLAIAQNVKSQTDYPLNLADTPAKPGQIVILWATGMGPISGADNTAPGAVGDMTGVPVTITVGGVTAQRLYAGRQAETAAVDNIYFTVPQGTGFGCQVPVVVTGGGTPANTTNIAITADGSPCQ
jgi:uncharacterized protein (TIGR03437 family)